MKQPPVNIKNKRATFDYELIDTYTAGIVLTGTEIKSIRLGKASLVDTFYLIAFFTYRLNILAISLRHVERGSCCLIKKNWKNFSGR